MAETSTPAAVERSAVVRAAGGVLWREAADGLEVAVVHRPKYDDWSLPKGKLSEGELSVVAGHREVLEETGFRAAVGRALGISRYEVEHRGQRVPKTVRWWAMRALEGSFTPSVEVDEVRWLPPDQALACLSRASEADPLRCFLAGPPRTRTLLLLRHGSAGSRREWTGDDDARPLDALGQVQARAAREVLPVYGVERLVSAPLERCAGTLRALADELGAPLELDESMTARGWSANPAQTVQQLRELVTAGRATVVCSQGEVLPQVLPVLAEGSAVPLRRAEARKGSLWALSFDDRGVLLDADYTESLLPDDGG